MNNTLPLAIVDPGCDSTLNRITDLGAGFTAVAYRSIDDVASVHTDRRPRTLFIEPLHSDRITFDTASVRQAVSLGFHVVVVSESRSAHHIVSAIAAGARGFLFKPGITPKQLALAAEASQSGLLLIAGEHVQLFDALSDPPSCQVELSAREAEVIGRIARGWTDKETAADLRLSEDTVGHYLTKLYRKFGVQNRAELVSVTGIAAMHKLIDGE